MKNSGDLALLSLAKSTILNTKNLNTKNLNTKISEKLDFGRWNQIKSGSFVTAYHTSKDISSENVWCCMSNGEYDAINFVPQNVQESAKICATRDSRKTIHKPKMFTVDILAPKQRWRRVTSDQLVREKNLTISVELFDGSSAIYLPSVWNERPEWSANQLIDNLARKAGNSLNIKSIYEIDTYEITESGSHNYGYFNHLINLSGGYNLITVSDNKKTIMKMLENIWGFYQRYAKSGDPSFVANDILLNPSNTSDDSELAYLVKNNGRTVSYDNEGALVRTLSDLTAYFKLAKILCYNSVVGTYPRGVSCPETLNLAKRRISREIERLRPQIHNNDPAEIASWIELLMTYDLNRYLSEICKNSLKLIELQENTPGVFGTNDLSFANPQALLALLNVIEAIDCKHDKMIFDNIKLLTDQFLNIYITNREMFAVDNRNQNDAFGANWVAQALIKTYRLFGTKAAKNYVTTKLIPILKEAFQAKRSITQEAVSAHALLIAQKYIDHAIIPADQINALINRWQTLQNKWKLGGFRYYENKDWYRSDVTSHVVEVLLLTITI